MLTPEAERELGRRIQTGDRDARDELVTRSIPFAKYLGDQHRRSTVPIDDLIQIASLALTQAADSFDPTLGFRFASYAKRWFLTELKEQIRSLRRMERAKTDPFLARPTATESEAIRTSELRELRSQVQAAVESLPARERAVIQIRYGLDGEETQTMRATATILGLSHSNVCRLEHSAFTRLRTLLNKDL
ncbi:MAG: sigma-70 family RNA polymerase sigma factor [Patescibacteria group bacterium]|nr:sigma-70 family RNA polymerase sigma factor [Patescibacteria group bacterium]